MVEQSWCLITVAYIGKQSDLSCRSQLQRLLSQHWTQPTQTHLPKIFDPSFTAPMPPSSSIRYPFLVSMRIAAINLYYLLIWINANCYTCWNRDSLKFQVYNKQKDRYSLLCSSSWLLFTECGLGSFKTIQICHFELCKRLTCTYKMA